MTFTIAAVQMDCRLSDSAGNLTAIIERLRRAADLGATLAIYPECILSGYGFANRGSVLEASDTIPGRATEALAKECDRLRIHAVVGMLEREEKTNRLFNSCALVGPGGLVTGYRKVHLPCMGADRFVEPGDKPFAIHDIGGLKIGLAICFDLSFPESARILTLMGADLVCLPTNWAAQARKMADLVCRVRAVENHVYVAVVNRVGEENGFPFIGYSAICDCSGDFLARAEHNRDAIITATIDPAIARQKKVVHCAGEYEIDRVGSRRPDLYEVLTKK